MAVVRLNDVSHAYGHVPLLAHVDFRIDRGERVCLVGRNGTGKSTLFRVIGGDIAPDDGLVWRQQTLRISHLVQDVPGNDPRSVFEVVAAGLGDLGRLLSEHHAAALSGDMARLHPLQQEIESRHGWNLNQRVDTVLSRLDLPADAPLQDCSGGIRRRVMLAQALVSDPDLLLLDEPTNHMDIPAIDWLEEYLLAFKGALMFITHDRTLVRRLATRIVELDRGRLSSWPGNFDSYARKKEELLDIELRARARFDRKLDEEEIWIRKGVKARRTRNEGRVHKLEEMRRQRAARLEQPGRVSLRADSGELSGKLVVELSGVGFSFDGTTLIRDFSTRILRGDRIGIIGPNGCGKSTLLRLLLGELRPRQGRVVHGTRLEIGYFDQQRSQLDLEKSVRDNISPGSDHVKVRGQSRHVIGYLRDFLFPTERVDSLVKSLSGGERNRLLLARVFTRSANMLVLDEPTNDLDVDTLELLEDLLSEYGGTLLLVSHDRTFLDNVVTSVIAFEGDGAVHEYVGGYADWIRQRRPPAPAPPRKPGTATRRPGLAGARKKLSYHLQRELDAMPDAIEALEQEQQSLQAEINEERFYRQDPDAVGAVLKRLESVSAQLDELYARWAVLEELQDPGDPAG